MIGSVDDDMKQKSGEEVSHHRVSLDIDNLQNVKHITIHYDVTPHCHQKMTDDR